MNSESLWPFFFEVNVIERSTFREKTLFVTIEEGGTQHWVDHSGRMGRMGPGEIRWDDQGEMIHFRGGKELNAQELENERREFTVTVPPTQYNAEKVVEVIQEAGKPWLSGWDVQKSKKLHDLLEEIYWKSVNEFVFTPYTRS